MASKRKRATGGDAIEWRSLAPAIGVVTLVAGVLAVAAALHVPDDPAAGPVTRVGEIEATAPDDPAADRDDEAIVHDFPPEAGTVPATAEEGGPLESRARRDLDRISDRRDGWTLQILVACEPSTVSRLSDRLGSRDPLFVLPYDREGRACYRVCWGVYETREEAVAGVDVPDGLLDGLGKPVPKEVSLVAP